ncbi:MAG: hypothetical protein RBT62_03980 [Spirochaetia bacterium]|nr:hypothetical protein [Spirochaetia bacterium]
MKAFFSIKNIAIGSATAILATALAFVLAIYAFKNIYYASVFLPVAMLSFLSVAWFSFLKSDGLGRRAAAGSEPGSVVPEPHPAEPTLVSGLGMKSVDEPATLLESSRGRLDHSMFAPRDSILVPRAGETGSSAARQSKASTARSGTNGRAVLLWAAIELGFLAALLYSGMGLGASFYH